MADGKPTHAGAVAGNRWPLGTRLRVSDSPYGPGVFIVEDRIGSGSELDFALPGDCAGARRWGRRTITVTEWRADGPPRPGPRLKLPAAAPAIHERDLHELMLDTRKCSNGHEEVLWRGTPASACWVCDRPWSNC